MADDQVHRCPRERTPLVVRHYPLTVYFAIQIVALRSYPQVPVEEPNRHVICALPTRHALLFFLLKVIPAASGAVILIDVVDGARSRHRGAIG